MWDSSSSLARFCCLSLFLRIHSLAISPSSAHQFSVFFRFHFFPSLHLSSPSSLTESVYVASIEFDTLDPLRLIRQNCEAPTRRGHVNLKFPLSQPLTVIVRVEKDNCVTKPVSFTSAIIATSKFHFSTSVASPLVFTIFNFVRSTHHKLFSAGLVRIDHFKAPSPDFLNWQIFLTFGTNCKIILRHASLTA